MFRHRMSAFVYILGAGVLFGFVAVLTRIIGKHLLDPNGLVLLNVQWYSVVAIAAAGGLGSWFVQNAYSGGPPDLVIAGLTVIDPIVGIAIGIVILGELRPDVHAVMAIAMGAAASLAIVGVIALSRHHPEVTKRKKDARKAAGRASQDITRLQQRPGTPAPTASRLISVSAARTVTTRSSPRDHARPTSIPLTILIAADTYPPHVNGAASSATAWPRA